MVTEDWRPTAHLRWSIAGKLQQKWARVVVTYLREYGGLKLNSPLRQEKHESEWRDVPSETVEGSRNA